MTLEQIEILMLDSTIDNYKAYVARCKRRAEQAQEIFFSAQQELKDMETKLQYMREAALRKGCV